jgi:hypothetical protein
MRTGTYVPSGTLPRSLTNPFHAVRFARRLNDRGWALMAKSVHAFQWDWGPSAIPAPYWDSHMPVTFINVDLSGMTEYCLAGDPWSSYFVTRRPVSEMTNELLGKIERHRFTPGME